MATTIGIWVCMIVATVEFLMCVVWRKLGNEHKEKMGMLVAIFATLIAIVLKL